MLLDDHDESWRTEVFTTTREGPVEVDLVLGPGVPSAAPDAADPAPPGR